VDSSGVRIWLGSSLVFAGGVFLLDRELERRLASYLASCSLPTADKRFPPHERTVDIRVELGAGPGSSEVLGADLSYDYVKENAEYRS
jgi:N-acetylglutamate synthase/N-acetylornithine aminotransferase